VERTSGRPLICLLSRSRSGPKPLTWDVDRRTHDRSDSSSGRTSTHWLRWQESSFGDDGRLHPDVLARTAGNEAARERRAKGPYLCSRRLCVLLRSGMALVRHARKSNVWTARGASAGRFVHTERCIESNNLQSSRSESRVSRPDSRRDCDHAVATETTTGRSFWRGPGRGKTNQRKSAPSVAAV
jgi:hypothetical protein